MDHPHAHCIVTGGGLSNDEGSLGGLRKNFFIPVRVMSALFRGKFLDYLKKSYDAKKIELTGSISHLAESYIFESFIRKLYHKKWVVYCKPPFNGHSRCSSLSDYWQTEGASTILLYAVCFSAVIRQRLLNLSLRLGRNLGSRSRGSMSPNVLFAAKARW
ncbi:MAG: transposase [Nitrospirae bacterium]|nr:transposase [Nitrospirota bacterium]